MKKKKVYFMELFRKGMYIRGINCYRRGVVACLVYKRQHIPVKTKESCFFSKGKHVNLFIDKALKYDTLALVQLCFE